jgi:hypothetical protein
MAAIATTSPRGDNRIADLVAACKKSHQLALLLIVSEVNDGWHTRNFWVGRQRELGACTPVRRSATLPATLVRETPHAQQALPYPG